MLNVTSTDIGPILRDHGIAAEIKSISELQRDDYAERDPETKEVRLIVRVDTEDGAAFVMRFKNEKDVTAELIESQSRFAAALKENSIRTPAQYCANGKYANWYTVGGYDVIVTLEQFVKNELRFVDEAAARKTGELLAKMHDIAERKDLHVENTVLFDPFGRNDLFDVDAFLSLENTFDGENKALFDAIVRRYHEYMEILSPLKARPRYAVQGDISDCNLYLADNGEIGVFDFNRCGDNILFCDAVMQAVFEARLMVYPEDRADDFEDRILSAFWEGYRAVRAFSADEQRWYPYLYAVIDAFWRCGDVDNLVNAQGAGDAAGVRHWLESIQKRLTVTAQ